MMSKNLRIGVFVLLFSCVYVSAQQPPSHFSDGFEAGFSTWSGTSLTERGTCSFDAPTITSELAHSGEYAAKAEFVLERSENGASCNGVMPNVHQDKNVYSVKMFEPGLKKFAIGAWFYIKKPERKSDRNHAQKFFYLLAKGNAPRFVVATNYDDFAGKHSVYVTYNTGAGGSHSLYGADSEVTPKDRGSANGILNLPYDEWFYLELKVDYKSGANADDSAIHLYYARDKEARTEVFRKTKYWSTDHCGSSTTRSCPAFPEDSMMGNKIREFRAGAQVDRDRDREAHEIRYWDDVTIVGE